MEETSNQLHRPPLGFVIDAGIWHRITAALGCEETTETFLTVRARVRTHALGFKVRSTGVEHGLQQSKLGGVEGLAIAASPTLPLNRAILWAVYGRPQPAPNWL